MSLAKADDEHSGTQAVNMLNQRFGNWIVIARGANKGSRAQWHCICQCAARTHRLVDGKQLRCGRSTSCGCLPPQAREHRAMASRAVIRSDGTAYASITEAAQATGTNKSSIARAYQTQEAWSHGFHWASADNPIAAEWIARKEREEAMKSERMVLNLPVCEQTDLELTERFLCDVVGPGTVRLATISDEGHALGTYFDLSKPAEMKRLRNYLKQHEDAVLNQYFTANVTGERIQGKSGIATNEDVTAIRMIVIDLDPEDGLPLSEARQRLRERAQMALDAEVPPWGVIDTGGGLQLLWLLEEPVSVLIAPESRNLAEGLMRSLARRYGGDTATCTLKNLFRLPGTRNLPTPTKRAKGRGVTYAGLPVGSGPRTTLDRLATFVPPDERESEESQEDPEGVGADWHELIDVLHEPEKLPPDTVDRINRTGLALGEILTAARFAPKGERSTADYRLACALARFQFPLRDAALTLAAHGSEKVAEKFIENDRGMDYVDRTVRKAYARVKEDDDRVNNLLTDLPEQGPVRPQEKYVFRDFNEILAAGRTPPVPLVKGYLHANSISVLYGPPNNGKTLLATDISYCVATGRPWAGMKTYPSGLVIYCVLEGAYGFTDRLFALHHHYAEDTQELRGRFIVLETSLDLRSEKGDTEPLIARMKALGEERGLPVTMIIFDTLVSTLGGGDENSSEHMNPVYQHASRFKEAFEAHVMFVAHSGKNMGKGIRGWSGQGAYIDSLFLIENDVITVEKQRYLAKPTKGLGFERRDYVVGQDEDGGNETAVVAVITGPVKMKPKEGSYGANRRAIIAVLRLAKEPMTVRQISEAIYAVEGVWLKESTIKGDLHRAKEKNLFKHHEMPGKATRYSFNDGSDLLITVPDE